MLKIIDVQVICANKLLKTKHRNQTAKNQNLLSSNRKIGLAAATPQFGGMPTSLFPKEIHGALFTISSKR